MEYLSLSLISGHSVRNICLAMRIALIAFLTAIIQTQVGFSFRTPQPPPPHCPYGVTITHDICRFRDGHYKGTIPPDQGVWTPTSGGNVPVTMLFTYQSS